MLETEAEQNYVLNLLWNNWRNYLELYTHIGGARNEFNTSASSFFWVPSGQALAYTPRWGWRQPDNVLGLESCMSIQRDFNNLTINDSPCTVEPIYLWKFICEKTV